MCEGVHGSYGQKTHFADTLASAQTSSKYWGNKLAQKNRLDISEVLCGVIFTFDFISSRKHHIGL